MTCVHCGLAKTDHRVIDGACLSRNRITYHHTNRFTPSEEQVCSCLPLPEPPGDGCPIHGKSPAAVQPAPQPATMPLTDGPDNAWPKSEPNLEGLKATLSQPAVGVGEEWRDPTQADLDAPLFEAIWQAIRTWDVNVPGQYVGYCGATGNHAVAILDKVRAELAKQPCVRCAELERDFGKVYCSYCGNHIATRPKDELEAEKANALAVAKIDEQRRTYDFHLAERTQLRDRCKVLEKALREIRPYALHKCVEHGWDVEDCKGLAKWKNPAIRAEDCTCGLSAADKQASAALGEKEEK